MTRDGARVAGDTVTRVRDAVRASGSPLASSIGAAPATYELEDGLDPPALAAAGPGSVPERDEVELAVAAVLEGCLAHYGRPRALQVSDPDLALLAGDRMYALGLARLAAVGDLVAIAELADVIALNAQAYAAEDEQLAHAVWAAGAAVIGWGPDAATDAAKSLARDGDRGAAAALRAAAVRPAG